MYEKSDYDVIGEIGNSAREYNNQDVILSNEGKLIPIFPRGSIVRPFEWIVGYAAISKNTYVAVVKSLIPPRLNRSISS
ncbi:MAG: hypothetical protein PHC40_04620 [Eubacteriales bacterium]|nr:hypothetical protein [Eubacteriales bacterium]